MQLVNQPTAAPTRKLKFGIWGGILVAAIVGGLSAYDAAAGTSLGAILTPVILVIAGSLGVAVPAYLVRSPAPQPADLDAAALDALVMERASELAAQLVAQGRKG